MISKSYRFAIIDELRHHPSLAQLLQIARFPLRLLQVEEDPVSSAKNTIQECLDSRAYPGDSSSPPVLRVFLFDVKDRGQSKTRP